MGPDPPAVVPGPFCPGCSIKQAGFDIEQRTPPLASGSEQKKPSRFWRGCKRESLPSPGGVANTPQEVQQCDRLLRPSVGSSAQRPTALPRGIARPTILNAGGRALSGSRPLDRGLAGMGSFTRRQLRAPLALDDRLAPRHRPHPHERGLVVGGQAVWEVAASRREEPEREAVARDLQAHGIFAITRAGTGAAGAPKGLPRDTAIRPWRRGAAA